MSTEEETQEDYSQISLRSKELEFKDGTWPCPEDLLKRNEEIENLSPVILNAKAPLVLALDAQWGGGKTTFIELWQRYLEQQGNVSLYINVWESDFSEDPLLPMLSALDKWFTDKSTSPKFRAFWEKAKNNASGILKSTAVLTTKVVTLGTIEADKEIEKLASEFTGNAVSSLLESFNKKKKSLEEFKRQLSKALETLPDSQKNLIIFIDELDRCKPTYAIEVLERIKHLFDVDRLVFVLAVNRDQLSKSLQGVYGPNFNGLHYLKRFIDLDYQLRVPNIKDYIKAMVVQPEFTRLFNDRREESQDYQYAGRLIGELASRFSYTLRDINQFISRLGLILRSIPNNHYLDTFILVPLMFLRQEKPELYQSYINNVMCANEVIEFLLKDSIDTATLNHELALAMGSIIAASRNPYGDQTSLSILLVPWKTRLEAMNDTNPMRDHVSTVIDWALQNRLSRLRGDMHVSAFKRIELISKININM